MAGCTNEKPCLVDDGRAHAPVCGRLRAQGAKPRPVRAAPRPAVLEPPPLPYQVVPGDGAIGCACGRHTLATREAQEVAFGLLHRYGRPCRPIGGALPCIAPGGEEVAMPERAGREGDQPLPTLGGESVFTEVRRRLNEREATGIRRYGRSLETFNGRSACRDLQEELLDGLAYATQVEMEHRAVVEALLVLARAHVPSLPRPTLGEMDAALGLAQKLEAAR